MTEMKSPYSMVEVHSSDGENLNVRVCFGLVYLPRRHGDTKEHEGILGGTLWLCGERKVHSRWSMVHSSEGEY